MNSPLSTLDRPDVDEATYLLAVITALTLAAHNATVQRQASDFAEAQKKQQAEAETAQQRQLADYKRAVEKQDDAFAADLQRHAEVTDTVKRRRLLLLISGGVSGVVFLLATLFGPAAFSSGAAGYIAPAGAALAVILLVAGLLNKVPPAPVAPQPLPTPRPLPPPAPLLPPEPPQLPDLPDLAKAFWQVTVAPFDQAGVIVIDSQIFPAAEASLPVTDLTAVKTLLDERHDLPAPEAIRALHRLHQALAVERRVQRLYLLATDAPLAPAVNALPANLPTTPEQAALEAPFLPGETGAEAAAMHAALADVAAFAERPFGLDPVAVQTLLKTSLDWTDQIIAAVETSAQGDRPADRHLQSIRAGGKTPQPGAQEAYQQLFTQLIADLRVEVDDLVHQTEQQAEEERNTARQRFDAGCRQDEDERTAVLRRFDDQIADLERRRLALDAKKQQTEFELQQATQAQKMLEEGIAKARKSVGDAKVEATRLENERNRADAAVQNLRQDITSLRARLETAQAKQHEATAELAALQLQLPALQEAHNRQRTADEAAATQLAALTRKAQALSSSSGVPPTVVKAMQQEAEAAKTSAALTRQAAGTAAADLAAAQARAKVVQQELAAIDDLAARLRRQEEQEPGLVQAATQAERTGVEHGSIVQAQQDRLERLQQEADHNAETGQIKLLQLSESQNAEQLSVVVAAIAAATEEKQKQQQAVTERQEALKQTLLAEIQQIDDRQKEQIPLITRHIDALISQQANLFGEAMDADGGEAVDGLEQALTAYRNAAIQQQKAQIQEAAGNVEQMIADAQAQVKRYRWPWEQPPATTSSYTFPVWFAKTESNAAWEVVAVGRTFSPQPAGAGQSLNAQSVAGAQPWLDHLRAAGVASRHADLLNHHALVFEPSVLSEQARLLANQHLIDKSLQAYLEQALATGRHSGSSPTTGV